MVKCTDRIDPVLKKQGEESYTKDGNAKASRTGGGALWAGTRSIWKSLATPHIAGNTSHGWPHLAWLATPHTLSECMRATVSG